MGSVLPPPLGFSAYVEADEADDQGSGEGLSVGRPYRALALTQ